MKLNVKVVPGASRSGVVGWLGDHLKVRVTAAPERGKANAAVEALIAELLELPPERVRIAAGHGSPRKVVEIDDMEEAEVRRRIDVRVGENVSPTPAALLPSPSGISPRPLASPLALWERGRG